MRDGYAPAFYVLAIFGIRGGVMMWQQDACTPLELSPSDAMASAVSVKTGRGKVPTKRISRATSLAIQKNQRLY